jgi:hypothetical protein
VEYINNTLNSNIDPTGNEIFTKITDGVLLCRLIQAIDATALPRGPITNFSGVNQMFNKLENLRMALEGAKRLGCSIVNIGPHDLYNGTPHLVFGILWQLVRVALLKKVSSLARSVRWRGCLCTDTPPEEILLQWFNYHLNNAGAQLIENLSTDLRDGIALLTLLHQLAPASCDSPTVLSEVSDYEERGEIVLRNAEKIGCNKFLTPADIAKANARLLLLFIANLFNKFPLRGDESNTRAAPRSTLPQSDSTPTRPPPRSTILLNNPTVGVVNQDILSQLRQEILKLKTENSYLRVDLEKQKQLQFELENHFHNTINQLREENISLSEQLDTFKKKQLPPDNSVLRLKEEHAQLKKEVERLNREIKKCNDEKNRLVAELEEVREKKDNELTTLIDENQSLRLRVSELEDQLQTQQQMDVSQSTSTSTKETESNTKELKKKIKQLNEIISQLQKSKTDEKEENVKLRQINHDLITEINELKQKLQSLLREKNDLNNKIEELERTLQHTNQNYNEIKKQFTEFETKYRQKQREEEEHNLQSDTKESEIKAKLEEEVKELKQKLRQYQERETRNERGTSDTERLLEAARVTFDRKEQELKEQLRQQQQKYEEQHRRDTLQLQQVKKALDRVQRRTQKLQQLMTPPQDKEGWLFKLSTNEKNLLKRWFILRGETLTYYREQKNKNLAKCAGAIYLPHSIITVLDESDAIKKSGKKKLKYAFLLESKYANHPYFLCTDNEDTRKEWIDAIEASKQYYESKESIVNENESESDTKQKEEEDKDKETQTKSKRRHRKKAKKKSKKMPQTEEKESPPVKTSPRKDSTNNSNTDNKESTSPEVGQTATKKSTSHLSSSSSSLKKEERAPSRKSSSRHSASSSKKDKASPEKSSSHRSASSSQKDKASLEKSSRRSSSSSKEDIAPTKKSISQRSSTSREEVVQGQETKETKND